MSREPEIEVVQANDPDAAGNPGGFRPGREPTQPVFTLMLPNDIVAALRKVITDAGRIDIKELEERIIAKCEHRLFKLLVAGNLMPPEALDRFEARNAKLLRKDADLTDAAMAALSQPSTPPQQPTTTAAPYQQQSTHVDQRGGP